ncbi:MAG: hypothetical protein ACXVAX_08600 [Pseudobdellovibrio sp.]
MPCCTCQKTKTTQICGICKEDLCKSCTCFVDADSFSFLKNIPAELQHTAYCGSCYNTHVAEKLNAYNETKEKAAELSIFMKNQGKETRLIPRKEKPFSIKDCADYNEAILRLAFFAVEAGFNSLLDVDLISKKVNIGGYQSTVWSGTAVPANVSDRKLLKDRSIWSNPN